MATTAGVVLMAKRILEKDWPKVREDYKTDIPVYRTENHTRCLIGGASLYIDRILEASNDADIDEDLYWALLYLFMVFDERTCNLDLDRFLKETGCVDRLAHKYRPEICKK